MRIVETTSGGRFQALALAALLLCGCSSPTGYWDIANIPAHGPEMVELRSKEGVTLSMSRDRLLMLHGLVNNLAVAARVHVDHLVLVDHRIPDAWARLDAKGKSAIGVSTGMLDFLSDDFDALAGVMGHEIGHLALKHREARGKDPRAKSDALAFSRFQERQADEFGIRITFAAGYDPEGLLRWNRRVQDRLGSIRYAHTHPSDAEREADMYRLVSGYTRAAEGSKSVRLWSLIGLQLEQRPDGLLVRRLGAGSTGNLMPGDRIVALEAPVETAVSGLDDVLKIVSPGRASQSFRFSVIRRDTRMPAYFHSRKRP
jgi:hypothetical protein